MSKLGTDARPLRVAIVGSGPSGFYAAEALLNAEPRVLLDMYDALPAPFGLVRYGVAPDHAKIKNITARYEKAAAHEDYAFFGNVNVGTDISVEEMREFYDAIVLACGAQTDRRLGIPGEDTPGSYTATEFVAWYNGHPDYRDRTFDLSGESSVIIGQGNVAIDVARILSKSVDELKSTDIAAHALDALAESRVREIHMVGRRGPVQAAFTPVELKEFGELEHCDPVVSAADLELNAASRAELDELNWRDARKNFDILTAFAGRGEPTKERRLFITFFRSPVEIVGDGAVEGVILERNELSGDPGSQRANGTGEKALLPCGSFFRSVGYRGVAIPGIPFEEKRGVVPNTEGRIESDGKALPGLYAVGWIKRGPSGVIGTNKPDSFETAKHVLADIDALPACPSPERDAVRTLLRERRCRVVEYADWLKIDTAEKERGAGVGKPREKFITIDEMLDAAGV